MYYKKMIHTFVDTTIASLEDDTTSLLTCLNYCHGTATHSDAQSNIPEQGALKRCDTE